jgi:hypothetical protein
MPTANDVITLALRRIGVVAEGEPPNADQIAAGREVLDSIVAEFASEAPIGWTVAAVPVVSYVPLANLLSVELAAHYARPVADTRARAWRRFAATVRQDNRPDPRDFDDDGIISDEEADAGARAAYY